MPFICSMIVGVFCLQAHRNDPHISVNASTVLFQNRIEIEGKEWKLAYQSTDMLRLDPRVPGIKQACIGSDCMDFRRSCADNKLRCDYNGNSGELDSFSVTADSPEAMQRAANSVAIYREGRRTSPIPLAVLNAAADKP